MGRVGFTTTIPVEVLLAAGKEPVDLNNLFIGSDHPQAMVEQAEEAGYPVPPADGSKDCIRQP